MKAKITLNPMTIADIERFSKKFSIQFNGCWEWNSFIDSNGYGRFSLRGKSRLAHRIMLFILNGKLNNDLEVDHLCRNRKCINPKHLEEVLSYENSKRGLLWTININKTKCKRGHDYNEKNTYIYSDGRRACRECDRLRPGRYKRKRG